MSQSYLENLQKTVDVFELDMTRKQDVDTTTLAVTTLSSKLKASIKQMLDYLGDSQTLLLNPIELFSKHYSEETKLLFQKCRKFRLDLDNAENEILKPNGK